MLGFELVVAIASIVEPAAIVVDHIWTNVGNEGASRGPRIIDVQRRLIRLRGLHGLTLPGSLFGAGECLINGLVEIGLSRETLFAPGLTKILIAGRICMLQLREKSDVRVVEGLGEVLPSNCEKGGERVRAACRAVMHIVHRPDPPP